MFRHRALTAMLACTTVFASLTAFSATSRTTAVTSRTICDTPWGMTIEPLFDVSGSHWAVRISGIRDGRAKTVGLLEDDIIVKANDLVVQSTDSLGAPQVLVSWFRALPCETPVTFTIVRGTTRMEIAAPGLKP